MLSNFKGRPGEKAPDTGASGGKLSAEPETTSSCIGPDMSVVGRVVCVSRLQIFGRVEGDVQAGALLIGDGGQIQGNIVAQEAIIRGKVKGVVRAVIVRLQGKAAVEGDIFHRSLAIEENALFEGSSRRVEDPIDNPQGREGNGRLKPAAPSAPAAAPGELAPIDLDAS
jgi:cytoskeletal protein CcmA (bactofilin family)